eukprot:360853-Chlamydomonas_euryale.AAC.4
MMTAPRKAAPPCRARPSAAPLPHQRRGNYRPVHQKRRHRLPARLRRLPSHIGSRSRDNAGPLRHHHHLRLAPLGISRRSRHWPGCRIPPSPLLHSELHSELPAPGARCSRRSVHRSVQSVAARAGRGRHLHPQLRPGVCAPALAAAAAAAAAGVPLVAVWSRLRPLGMRAHRGQTHMAGTPRRSCATRTLAARANAARLVGARHWAGAASVRAAQPSGPGHQPQPSGPGHQPQPSGPGHQPWRLPHTRSAHGQAARWPLSRCQREGAWPAAGQCRWLPRPPRPPGPPPRSSTGATSVRATAQRAHAARSPRRRAWQRPSRTHAGSAARRWRAAAPQLRPQPPRKPGAVGRSQRRRRRRCRPAVALQRRPCHVHEHPARSPPAAPFAPRPTHPCRHRPAPHAMPLRAAMRALRPRASGCRPAAAPPAVAELAHLLLLLLLLLLR